MTAEPNHAVLMNELRYAERLCARTARLYQRIGAACTFLGVVGGSGTLAALAPVFPAWVSMCGAVLLTLAGAVQLTVRPFEKATANKADATKYTRLRTLAIGMSAVELARAKAAAHESDADEVELLRNVAYNDVVREIGADGSVVPLSFPERLLAALA